MLTAYEVERMRLTVDRTLPDRVDIERMTRESDGGGGYRDTWEPFLTDVPCRVGLPGGGESDERNISRVRIADEDTQMIYMTAETDVIETDRITWQGVTYEVTAVLRRGEWELCRRVKVKEL